MSLLHILNSNAPQEHGLMDTYTLTLSFTNGSMAHNAQNLNTPQNIIAHNTFISFANMVLFYMVTSLHILHTITMTNLK